MKKTILFILALVLSVTLVSPVSAAVFTGEDTSTITEEVNDDLFTAGNTVSVEAPVMGELFAAGQTVVIDEPAQRSVFAAGENVEVNGAGYNVFAAGSNVKVGGTINHDAYIAGATITIDNDTVINGNLYISGSRVTLAGTIKGDVYVSGQDVVSSATMGGNVKGDVQSLRFTGGSIAGNLTYAAPADAQDLSKVTVGGETKRNEPTKFAAPNMTVQGWLWGVLTTIVVGAALLILFGKKVAAVTGTVAANWVQSFMWGLGLLIVTPILLGLLMITIIGIPISLVGFLLYGIGLYFATIMGTIFVGRRLLMLAKTWNKRDSWWLALVAGAIVVSLIKLIPLVSFLVFVGITIPTFGALGMWWRDFIRDQQAK